MKLRKNHAGFTLVEALLVLIFLSIVGFIGYYVYHSQKKPAAPKPNPSAAKTQPADTSSDSGVFSSDDPTAKLATIDSQLTFKYPSDWTMAQTSMPTDSGKTTQYTTVTAPDGGAYVQVKRQTGGIGGAYCVEDNTLSDIHGLAEHTLSDYKAFTLVTGYSPQQGPIANVISTSDADKLRATGNTCDSMTAVKLPADLFSASDNGYQGATVTISSSSLDSFKAQSKMPDEASFNKFAGSKDFSNAITIVQTLKKR